MNSLQEVTLIGFRRELLSHRSNRGREKLPPNGGNANSPAKIIEATNPRAAQVEPTGSPEGFLMSIAHPHAWRSHALLTALVACNLFAVTNHAAAKEPASSSMAVCADRDLKVVIWIEQHSQAADVPSNKLVEAAFTMLQARNDCYGGRHSEGIALYDGVLAPGPVTAQRTK